jgi:hypothetical protein
VVAPTSTTISGVLLNVWTTMSGQSKKKCLEPLNYSNRSAAIALLNQLLQHDRAVEGRFGQGDEMGSSVEGLKLRRMRILQCPS